MSERRATNLTFSFTQMADHLQIEPRTLRAWNRHFAPALDADIDDDEPRYSGNDLAALTIAQRLLDRGQAFDEVLEHLAPSPSQDTPSELADEIDLPPTDFSVREYAAPELPMSLENAEGQSFAVSQMVGDAFRAIATGQQSMLNNQSNLRDTLGIVVQDNFNLKDENRKLRERMVEVERTLAEYQRREELRKERLESRVRALEGTVNALQQQVVQVMQALRRQPPPQRKRRGFFG